MATRVDERNVTLDLSWHNIRRKVLRDILSDEMIPVPSLVAASHFGLFSVFVKKKETFGQRVASALKTPTYHVIGHLSQVIQLDKTNVNLLLQGSQPHGLDITSQKWSYEQNFVGELVHLTVEQSSKFAVPITLNEGDLFLNPDIPELTGSKSVYIITDVMKANITAVITDDEDSIERIPVGSLPIAFSYSKFRLMPDGKVGEQLKCNLRFGGKWKVVVDRLGEYLNHFDAGEPDVAAHDDDGRRVDNNHADVSDDDNGSGPDGTHG